MDWRTSSKTIARAAGAGACLLVLAAGPTHAWGVSYDLATDVPARLDGTDYTTNLIIRSDSAAYATEATLPGGITLSGLHRRVDGSWLLVPSHPVTLDTVTYTPRDVISYDGVTFAMHLQGGVAGIQEDARIDALFLEEGDLVLSFDVPVNLGGTEYSRSDLVRFSTGSFSLFWDAEGPGVPAGSNLVGADQHCEGALIVTFDVPTNLGGTDYLPGQLVGWNGTAFSGFFADPNWPASAQLRDFSLRVGPGAAVPPSLAGWWPGDSHAADIQGGNDGVPVNGAGYAGGRVADAFDVSPAQTGFFAIPDAPSLDFGPSAGSGAGDLTLDAWIQTTSVSGVRVILDKRASEGGALHGYSLFLDQGNLGFQLADGVGAPQHTSFGPGVAAPAVGDGSWHHIAVTVDRDAPAGGVFYFDGQPFGNPFDPTVRGGGLSNGSELWIGRETVSPWSHFDGRIDEVEVFRRALSAAEILAIFAAGPNGKCRKLICNDNDADPFGSPANPTCSDPSRSDCNLNDANAWGRPGQVPNLSWAAGTTDTLVWDAVDEPGAAAILYDVVLSVIASDFVTGAQCVASDQAGTSAVDATPVVNINYYLVRAENACPGPNGRGIPGRASNGSPRIARDCP